MLPVLPFVIGGVVGLVAGVVAKTIIDNREEEFVNIEEDISNGGTYTSLLTFSKKSKNQILHSTNPFVKGF